MPQKIRAVARVGLYAVPKIAQLIRDYPWNERWLFFRWLFAGGGLSILKEGFALMSQTTRYSRMKEHGYTSRIGIFGESTAEGVGASTPRYTIAGYLGESFPDATIYNFGDSGTRVKQVIAQLKQAGDASLTFDLVIILIGTNDIFCRTPKEQLEVHLDEALKLARSMSPYVILMQGGDPGAMPAFQSVPPLAKTLTVRTRELHEVFRTVAARYGVILLEEIVLATQQEEFLVNANEWFSPHDRVHPNDHCYLLLSWEILGRIVALGLSL